MAIKSLSKDLAGLDEAGKDYNFIPTKFNADGMETVLHSTYTNTRSAIDLTASHLERVVT